MDDLISRKETENTIRKMLMETAINCADAGDPLDEFYADIAHNRLETWISRIPAAPVSVPLEPLCEWLAKFGCPCEINDGMCDMSHGVDRCLGIFKSNAFCWRYLLTKMMEEQNAAD